MFTSTEVSCTIPVNELREAPFNLLWGSQIIAKVVAVNSYGNSVESEQGSSAIILTKPDAPSDFTEEITFRTESNLKLTWIKAPFVGGAEVLDFRITKLFESDGSSKVFDGLVEPYYQVIDLIKG